MLARRPRPTLRLSPQCTFRRWLAKKKKGGNRGTKGGGGKGGDAARTKGGEGTPGQFVARLEHVHKVLPGGRVLFNDVSLGLLSGAKVGILGPNGAGKSSLLRLLAGTDSEHEGNVWRAPSLRVGMLEQEPQLDESRCVLDNVLDGVSDARNALDRFEVVSALIEAGGGYGGGDGGGGGGGGDGEARPLESLSLEELLGEQAAAGDAVEALDCWNLRLEARTAMEALRCPPGEAMPAVLSGGQRRRVALCRLLLTKPELLLLDEPTNHLDTASVAWLEAWLAAFRGTVVAVTHDRYFLDNVAGYIVEVDSGFARPFRGNYSGWLKHKAEAMRLEDLREEARAARLKGELAWINQNARGGRAKSKARLRSYEKLLDEARDARNAERVQSGAISIVPGPRLGNQVLSAHGLTKSYGERTLFRDLSFELPPGAVLGVVGANGMGKSTLIRLIVGEEEADAGEVRVGATVALGYVDQSRSGLDARNSVYEEIAQGVDFLTVGGREVSMRAYVAAFNLRGTMQEKLVSNLSGGERGRVHLAKTLRRGCNLLLLDEPTNDLDVDTLRSLEEAIGAFAGSAVIVSHDRWFLDRVCDHTLAFDAAGGADFFEGSISDYDAWRARRHDSGEDCATSAAG